MEGQRFPLEMTTDTATTDVSPEFIKSHAKAMLTAPERHRKAMGISEGQYLTWRGTARDMLGDMQVHPNPGARPVRRV